jgi:serine/threonine protein kinase
MQLLSFLKNAVEVFALAQMKNICHRDIKLQNILVDDSGDFKISDFGCSSFGKQGFQTATIAGTVSYLSPVLLDAYSSGSRHTKHDRYKSDVFSLGLTTLFMAKLEVIAGLNKFSNQALCESVVDTLHTMPTLRNIIRLMLTFDEESRMDFKELFEHLNNYDIRDV